MNLKNSSENFISIFKKLICSECNWILEKIKLNEDLFPDFKKNKIARVVGSYSKNSIA